jgi:hypothetical protein
MWQRSGFTPSLLPFTLALVVLGFAGLRIIVKLFERSMSHFSLAEAYLDALHVLLHDEAETHFKGRVRELRYVRDTEWELEQGILNEGMFDVSFPGGDRKTGVVTPEMLEKELERHNPINPRPIVVPRHNRAVVFFKKMWRLKTNFAAVDLRRQWQWLYVGILTAGLALTAIVFSVWASDILKGD